MLDLALRSALRLIEPVGFAWACLVLLTLLSLRKRQVRLAAGAGALAVFIWVIGATPLPGSLLASLERPWVGVKREALPEADVVVLLGGFSAPSREEVGRLHFNQSADRAVTALELLRLGKAKTLVVGGSALMANGEPFAEADLFKGVLRRAGDHQPGRVQAHAARGGEGRAAGGGARLEARAAGHVRVAPAAGDGRVPHHDGAGDRAGAQRVPHQREHHHDGQHRPDPALGGFCEGRGVAARGHRLAGVSVARVDFR
jgi:hypothetical protein